MTATLSVKREDLDSDNFDLDDPDDLKEAILSWVESHAKPGVYLPDYSGRNAFVSIRGKNAYYELPYDMDEFEVNLCD